MSLHFILELKCPKFVLLFQGVWIMNVFIDHVILFLGKSCRHTYNCNSYQFDILFGCVN